jgi:hypothetical protein
MGTVAIEPTKVGGESRGIDQLIKDFEGSKGEFESFYDSMNDVEEEIFKGYLNSMRPPE